MLCLHINNVSAKKRGTARNIIRTIRAIMISTWLQATVMGRHGGANIEVTKVLLTMPLETVRYLHRRAPHLCGVPALFRTFGPMYVGLSSRLTQTNTGRYESTARSPFHKKFLACARTIRVVTMKYGFILTWLSCTTKEYPPTVFNSRSDGGGTSVIL